MTAKKTDQSLPSVYITAMGAYMPGDPVDNEAVEKRLGMIHSKPSRARHRVLKQSGIQTRYYAIDDKQETQISNCEMATAAIRDALARTQIDLNDIDFLAAATTQGDLLVPGFASMVHGELKNPACEIATLHGVCCSGLMALKTAYLQVRAGEKTNAVACASEFPSRTFKASRYERQDIVREASLPFDTEFLRWMLSDGAGAALIQPQPSVRGLSLRIDGIRIRSYAHQNSVCMFAGVNKMCDGTLSPSWWDYPSFEAAAQTGAINLKQDVRMLDDVVKLGVDGFFECIEEGWVDPDALDWIVCHYSSEFFKSRIFELLNLGGVRIPEERWFSNLTTKGNVGSASTFVLLEELFNSGKLQEGQRLLLMIPESGRSTMGYAIMTVVGRASTTRTVSRTTDAPKAAIPKLETDPDPVIDHLVRQLMHVWVTFEASLRTVPLLERLYARQWTLREYQSLLVNLRQQVIEGSRWIARAASSIDSQHTELRSMFIAHAQDEHRHYEMLERDYVATGGELRIIRTAAKNIGSEALSAWMFHRASQPNPVDVLGAMFIIEGLGVTMAGEWARQIAEHLELEETQISFLRYHSQHDSDHFGRLKRALNSGFIDAPLAERIVKTAKVTARLYRLQLEEIGQF